MTIVLVCNKCLSDDLHRSKWADEFECPNCGTIQLYNTHTLEPILLVRKELDNAQEAAIQRTDNTH